MTDQFTLRFSLAALIVCSALSCCGTVKAEAPARHTSMTPRTLATRTGREANCDICIERAKRKARQECRDRDPSKPKCVANDGLA